MEAVQTDAVNELKMTKEEPIHSDRMLNGISNGLGSKSDGHHKHKHKDKDKDREKDRHHDRHKHKDKERDKEKHGHSSHSSSSKDRDKSKSSENSEKKNKDERKDKEKDSKERSKENKDKEHREKENKDKEREHKDKVKDKSKEHKDKENKEHKDKERKDKEHRDKHKEHRSGEHKSSSSKDREKEHKSSSSSTSNKTNDSSSSSKEKDKEKHKDKEREKDKSSRDKEKSHSSSKHSSSDKHKHSSSSGDKSSTTEKSSSNSKHSSSSKDKDRDKNKDRDRSSSKHSSSLTDKSKDSERKEKDKDRNKEKDKNSHGKDVKSSESKVSSSSSSSNKVKVKREVPEVKQELRDDGYGDSGIIINSSCSYIKEEIKPQVKSEVLDESSFTMSVNDPYGSSQGYGTADEETANDRTSATEKRDQDYEQEESDEDIPLAKRNSVTNRKRKISENEESDDDVPLIARKKIKQEVKSSKKQKRKQIYSEEESEEEDFKPAKKKAAKKESKVIKKEVKAEPSSTTTTPTKRKKKEEEEQEVWKWWEEEKKEDGVKWNFLEHKGPMFAPLYEPLPPNVKFYYDGKEMALSEPTEEVATFYSKLIEHDYTTKDAFNKNFFKDWRKVMTNKEKEIITDLKKCDFRKMYQYFVQKSEERKAMTKEEKKKLKEENEEIAKEYGFCTIDGHKEKIGNFKIEPPGLFRGRGEHPKMGMLKKRVMPEDVIINCSKTSNIPSPPKGHKWKEVRHDNTVTWLASWTENVQGNVKYVMLNPSSKLKGEKDWQKYETARRLAKFIGKIRRDYREDWKSKEMRIRQRAVAMYFIDILALRAGNEKDEDQADTVGCCSLRVEHIQLHEHKDGKDYVVVFDFLGKDSIRYYNEVPVEKRVFKNLQLFCERKKGSDDLFDRLNTAVLNKHLNELMEGLTAKVFRTYNASFTLQNQLNELTDPNASVPEKVLQYNRANRAVAILCNHQRSIPKSHEKSMGNLKQKIDSKREQVQDAKRQLKDAKRDAKDGTAHSKMALEKKKKALERLQEQLTKLEVQETDKEENKTIALGTSKLNYLDPRISVAWCKKYGVPIEKIYNKTQRSKFRWAIDMAGPDYVF